MVGNDSKKGIPTKSKSASRKARRIKNWSKQPERKLRHILHRMKGVTPPAKLREAFDWAVAHNCKGLVMDLRPGIQAELAAFGQVES